MSNNLRFWVYVNDCYVKLTLRPGQELSHGSSGPTEEGYFREHQVWAHCGESVAREWYRGERDCDGYFERDSECEVAADRLREIEPVCWDDEPRDPAIMLPAWEVVGRGQRDHTAEAAGY